MKTDFLSGLNEQQVEALKHKDGPLLILAGAGSGKTKTLTHRIAYLIEEKGVQPSNILAVTFTNKAAGEMRERVEKLLSSYSQLRMPFLGTFHGICVKILRQDGEYLGIDRNFIIFDAADSLATIKQAMRQLKIDEKQHSPKTIAGYISTAKNELIDAAGYSNYKGSPTQVQAGKVYPAYERLLKENKALDFDDLIMKTVLLFQKYPEVLAKWQRQFKHVMIDEYQDTNTAQYELSKLLAKEHENICVVGDDWQSIYSWRGADFRNILNFNKDYKKVKTIKLEQNYRSTKPILDGAHQIISKNRKRSDKKLWTDQQEGAPIRSLQAQDERHEGELIYQIIKSQVSGGARKYKDFAILYRTNAQSRALEESFIRYGLPYRIVGGTRFYERKEIKDILAYLRLIYQPSDRASFARVVNVPTRGIGAKSLEKLFAWLDSGTIETQGGLALEYKTPSTLWQALAQIEDAPGLTPRAKKSLAGFYELIERLRDFNDEGASLPELVGAAINRIGYLDYLKDGTIQSEERQENVKELISVAKEYQDMGLAGFLEEVALISDVDSYDTAADAVTMMTLHSAKGLEFLVVFISGMEETVLPHSRALFDQEEMEEERRLCYVGMTRAKEELYLVHASSRLLYGSSQHNPPSRFLSEIEAQEEVAPSMSSGKSIMNGSELQGRTLVDIEVGDSVRHPVFGDGTVEDLDGEVATVTFGSRGPKKLNIAFAPLEKIS